MKTLTLMVLLIGSLSVWASPNLDQKISLMAKKITAAEALQKISERSGIEFVVSPEVPATRKISIAVKEASLKDVLDFFATELGAKWKPDAGNSVTFSVIRVQ